MRRYLALLLLVFAAFPALAHDVPTCPQGQTLYWSRNGPPEYTSHPDLCAAYGRIPYHDDAMGGYGFACKQAVDPPDAMGGIGLECKPTVQQPTNVCPGGITRSINVTLGFNGNDQDTGAAPEYAPDGSPMTSSKWSTIVGGLTGTMCVNGCPWKGSSVDMVYSSDQPTPNGLYRWSANVTATSESATQNCSPSQSDLSGTEATHPPPACQGFEGYVNGRKACIPKVPPSGIDGGGTPGNKTTGNPTAGSEGKPSDIPTVNTPGLVEGGNQGGPPHPKDGTVTTPTGVTITPTNSTNTSGTKTSVEGEEQLACGAPGQPPCKIDESGTPTGTGALSSAEAALTGAQTNATTALEAHKSLQAPPWTWTFQLPTGCTPLVLEAFNFTVNPCDWQGMIHNLMGMLWMMAATFLCVRMVFNTVGD